MSTRDEVIAATVSKIMDDIEDAITDNINDLDLHEIGINPDRFGKRAQEKLNAFQEEVMDNVCQSFKSIYMQD